MDSGTVIMIVIVVLVVLVGIWFIAAYNGFVRLRNGVEEAFATMDVYMKKRYDLIPNLVETVKGYASHERETLDSVTKARNIAAGAQTLEEKAAGENMLSGTLKSLFAVAEKLSKFEGKRKLHGFTETVAKNGRGYCQFQKVLQCSSQRV